ncbi:MAG: 30S ribosomal protein S16 [Parcubacteria group bacterium GW2011_GWA1_47_8]|nr:MAG: 30S ribosomal protein S16 [Parcubacteria group bacterium GW2011_GWA1_47_8]KKW07788.1 MAG: 30S ribosomal protein S16 [Parcubacteria group bacterium GW2011_GWA2_49_16]
MLNIRLQRVGRKNDPSFRVIVTDSKWKPKTGKFVEIIGSYDARKGSPVIKADRAKHWLSVGAQASGTVHNLLLDLKVIAGKKVNVLGKKTPIVKEAPAEVVAEKPAEEAPKKEETPASAIAEAVADKPAVAEAALDKPAEEAPAEEILAEKA